MVEPRILNGGGVHVAPVSRRFARAQSCRASALFRLRAARSGSGLALAGLELRLELKGLLAGNSPKCQRADRADGLVLMGALKQPVAVILVAADDRGNLRHCQIFVGQIRNSTASRSLSVLVPKPEARDNIGSFAQQ